MEEKGKKPGKSGKKTEEAIRASSSGKRYFIPGALFAVILAAFFARAVWLGGTAPVAPGNIAGGEKTVTVPAERGRIFDRSGVLLAENSYTYRLDCRSEAYIYSDEAVEGLYLLLLEYSCGENFPGYSELGEYLRSAEKVTLSENIPMSMIAYLLTERPEGLSVEKELHRVYYDEGSATHILGQTGMITASSLEYYSELGYPMDVTVGTGGCEKAFEEYLHGIDGQMKVTYDGAGNTIKTEITEQPVPGNDIYLTIDIALQKTAAQSLSAKVAEVGSDGGAITASDVRTGELLVAVSCPTYTAQEYNESYNELASDASSPLFNRALAGKYAPGSVMKLATAVAALEEGILSPGDRIEDLGVYTYYADSGYSPQCWLYGRDGTTHGSIDIRQAITHSCNYFFFEASRLTGIEAMNFWARRLGLGEKTGLELWEASPVLAGPAERAEKGEYWGSGETLAAAIGQSDNLFSPTQICSFISVLANGGTRYGGHILLRVCDRDGVVINEREPEIIGSATISESTLDTVRGGMYDSAHTGTVGRVFADRGYEVAGKTGTAQISDEESNSLFAVYAPYSSPEIAAVCVIENGSDGFNSAYPAQELLSAYFASRS